ncbi:MAG: peptidoglycan-binding protein, partial [Nitrospirae bacterium]|nr:peptidoglycan-binding protein [Nitrospirota bacterium]
MARYQRGSKGEEVSRIQARLKELGYYLDPIDADFGGGTEKAVKAFQRVAGLKADGKVGAKTWACLFEGPEAPAQPET